MTLATTEQDNGYFINHPDFGDVSKTGYLKGTITDFEVVQEEPFTVAPRVKVNGSWGESDWIPILYQPKEGYWDTTDYDATDFNEVSQYYENSWMSFRIDDEVIVQVVEDVAQAVVGFADGYPRIGEDVICIEASGVGDLGAENPYYISATKAQETSDDDPTNPNFPDSWTISHVGPDDFDLGLLKEAELAVGSVEESTIEYYDRTWGFTNYLNYDYPTRLYWKKSISTNRCKIGVWPVIVGPILYAIFVSALKSSSEKTWYRVDQGEGAGGALIGPYSSPEHVIWWRQVTVEQHVAGVGGWGVTEWDEWYNYWIVDVDEYAYPTADPPWGTEQATDDSPIDGGYSYTEDDDYWTFYFEVKAGLYSQSLYDQVMACAGSIDPVAACGVTKNATSTVFSYAGPDFELGDDYFQGSPEMTIQKGFSWFLTNPDFTPEDFQSPEGFTWLSRPHTKEELQDAGLWPF